MATITYFGALSQRLGQISGSVPVNSNSDAIASHRGNSMTIVVRPTGGTAKVQYTLSSSTKIEAGTATWIDWSYGDVTVETVSVFSSAITAFRVVTSSGATATWEAVIW